MFLCPNLPLTSLNQLSKADNKHKELTVLIYTLCLCLKPCPFLCALILNKDLALLIKIRVRSRGGNSEIFGFYFSGNQFYDYRISANSTR